LETAKDIATKRGKDLSGGQIYPRAKFNTDRLHHY